MIIYSNYLLISHSHEKWRLLFSQSIDYSFAPGKFYIFALFLYFVFGRIFWILLNLLQTRPSKQSSVNLQKQIESSPVKEDIKVIRKDIKKELPSQKNIAVPSKKKRGWGKKIQFRRKNFGSLDAWDPEPEMKRVLLWTGYGPLQEGMLLWKRVLSDIGEYIIVICR